MKTAVIYARYSSERQTEQSIEGQLRCCYDYAERNDIVIVDKYIDRATTGTNDNRAQFQKMLKDSKKRAWDIVLVYKLDRFSRNKYEMAMHKRALRDNGIKVVSAMENIPDTPEGIILESLLEGMAEYYSAELSQKVRRGQRETRLKGNFTGGLIVYGYKVENKKILIDEEQAEVVRNIFQQYASGVIVKDIIAGLTARGIYNRGKPFARNTMYRLLGNEKYSGVFHHDDEVYTDMYPQIVPTPIYNLVSKKIEENQYGKRSIEVVYLLRTKMICGYCGKPIAAETGTSKSGKVSRYYKCQTRKRGHKCRKSVVRKDMIENIIVDITCQVLNNPETVNNVADRIMESHQRRLQDQSVLNILIKEQNGIRKSIDNIMSAIEKGVVTSSTKRRLDELETAQEDLTAKIAIERTKVMVRLTKEEIIGYIRTALKKEPRQMIDLLIKRIILFDDKIEITYNYIDDSNPDGESRDFIFYECSINVPLSPPQVLGVESAVVTGFCLCSASVPLLCSVGLYWDNALSLKSMYGIEWFTPRECGIMIN